MDDNSALQAIKERFDAEHLRRARAVHDASTEHVIARVNQLHSLVSISIAPEMIDLRRREELEAELLEAINRASAKALEAELDGCDPLVCRMTELLIPRF